MTTSPIASSMIGWLAIATGITGFLALVFIILFFSIGQPFGTLNDIFIGVTALMSAILAGVLYAEHHAQSPLLSLFALIIAVIGALVVVIGSVLAISGRTGWFLSGLYMAAGNAMVGLWLLGLNYSALRGNSFPQSLAIFGIISGAVMALGLVTIPGIFRGVDTQEYELTIFNYIWWASSMGYLALYPIWCVLLGRFFLLK
jgi:uncharacterized membrane protein YeaQ/YmgE (transglycosylase-associated protein family)